MKVIFKKIGIVFVLFFLFINACASPRIEEAEEEEDPAEVAVGERLFKETRFAEFFFSNSNGQINQALVSGDPTMDSTLTLLGSLPGPFKGQSMNCSACHLVDQQLNFSGGGMRAYNDFAARSPIPTREDGRVLTPRNSPPLVNSTLFREGDVFLHFDGEFTTIESLVRATLTGRNYGWMPDETDLAISHIAAVIKGDDGNSILAQEFGGFSLKTLLEGTDPFIPEELRIPRSFRIDFATASNEDIVDAVAKLIAAYVNSLVFSQDATGEFNASPYDLFLKKNALPRKPAPGETPLAYAKRLRAALDQLEAPEFVTEEDGSFQFHDQIFKFGSEELEGLKIFLNEPPQLPLTAQQIATGKIGNCIACHTPPNFTDFMFHNTGVTQREYDDIHGEGQFMTLFIPDFAEREANFDLYMPPSRVHPDALGNFVTIPDLDYPERTDLGLWNMFGNSDHPEIQGALLHTLCNAVGQEVPCTAEDLLPLTIARFKTPGLRDLGHGAPYMHNGQFPTIEDVILHYIDFSKLARSGALRNSPNEFEGMALLHQDGSSLSAFLRSLNEDYE